jgi:hypothetical protein
MVQDSFIDYRACYPVVGEVCGSGEIYGDVSSGSNDGGCG